MKLTRFEAAPSLPRPDRPDDLRELREETVRTVILGTVAVGYLLVLAAIAVLPASPWEPLPELLGLSLTAVLAHFALKCGPGAATFALVTGMSLTLAGALTMHPGSNLAVLFFVVVLIGLGSAGWRGGLGAALLISALLPVFQTALPGVIPGEVALLALVAVWVAFGITWLALRPLDTTVAWAWSSYRLAETRTAEARLRQGELSQLSRSLNVACDRLERLNRELAEARAAADSARRMKAEFAATVGHELRTPVNLIIGFSQMMASARHQAYYDVPLPAVYRDDVRAIYLNASHISSLVDDILDLSQIDAQRMALRKEPTCLAQVAQEAVDSVAALYADAGLSLGVEVARDLAPVTADPVRVRQVLINLLYNAVRFTHAGGVTIDAREGAGEVVVMVRDTGVGIADQDLPRLFDEFRQFQPAKRGHGGSGLGLAVCKRFVELHGGNIWAESEAGVGTTILFSLPRQENLAVTPLRALRGSATYAGRNGVERCGVAVIDPHGDTTRIFERYLDGYKVRRARSPEQVRRLVVDGEVRAVVVASPAGQDVWARYQEAHPELGAVPTLLCSLRDRTAIADSLGVREYLVKPVTREQLAAALKRQRGGPTSGEPTPKRFRQVIVIEDDAEMRSFLVRTVRAFRSPRYQVLEASDGVEGLRLLREAPPDLVLLDLLMPKLDGFGVLRELRADSRLREIPVVVISAKGPVEDVTAGMVGTSRASGLSVGEAMTLVKANLDALVSDRGGG